MDHLLVTCNQRCKGLGVAVPNLAYPTFFFVRLAHATFLTDMTTHAEQSFEVSSTAAVEEYPRRSIPTHRNLLSHGHFLSVAPHLASARRGSGTGVSPVCLSI